MMAPIVFLFSAAVAAASPSAVRSGQASAEWLSASSTYQPAQPLQTIVRIAVDKGWHTYWENPGEAGMKVAVEWELPPGWKAGKLEYPAPSRFIAGDLVGFGYAGTVDFPITFTAPADASGKITLHGEVSWLTCDDHACIPGKAKVELTLDAGPVASTPAAAAVAVAQTKISQRVEGASLAVKQSEKSLEFTVTTDPKKRFDPAACDVFVLTEAAVDPTAPIRFQKSGETWTAAAQVSEYASEPLQKLSLVFVLPSDQTQIELAWTMGKNP